MSQAHPIIAIAEQDECAATEQGQFAEARAAEKAEAERRNALAARSVASHSIDAADCVSLLTMLGLDAAAGRAAESM